VFKRVTKPKAAFSTFVEVSFSRLCNLRTFLRDRDQCNAKLCCLTWFVDLVQYVTYQLTNSGWVIHSLVLCHAIRELRYHLYKCKLHNGSPNEVKVSTPIPLLMVRIFPLDIFICPTANACSFPSAITATTVSTGISTSVGMRAPFEVRPGHLNKVSGLDFLIT
jgi:hypothetical protein